MSFIDKIKDAVVTENGKVKLKVGGMSLEMDWLFLMIIDMAAKIGDQLISGENLSDDQKRLIQTLDALAKIWGPSAVNSTRTEIDDEALEEVLRLFEDTSKEGSFKLLKFVQQAT